jgi:hypothetical protein
VTYHVTHTTGAGERVAGGEVAAAPDWADFADWAALLPEDFYPELRRLGAWGRCFPAEALGELEGELETALRIERPGEGVAGVGERLLAALRRRPGGAWALSVRGGRGGP